MIQRRLHSVVTPDGVSLAVTSFGAAGTRRERVAVLLCAIGARQDRFEPFARHLAREGWWVLTFDYRGIGRSALPPERRQLASIRAWGEQDLTAVLRWAREELSPSRLVAVGHSIGGQILPFSPEHRRLDAVALVASQRGWWRLWTGWKRYGVLFFFAVYVPLCLRLFGRVPLSLVGLDDLERGVAEDYARWGLANGYLWPAGEERSALFAECTFPLLALSFEDDTSYAPRRAVEVLLHDYYTSAPAVWCHVEHRRLGLRGLGHSGFFDPRLCPASWWTELSEWLHTASPGSPLLPQGKGEGGVPSLSSVAGSVLRRAPPLRDAALRAG